MKVRSHNDIWGDESSKKRGQQVQRSWGRNRLMCRRSCKEASVSGRVTE